MARRRKSSAAENIMDLVALAPWWVGVVLAIVGYLVLHYVAGSPQIKVTSGTALAAPMARAAMLGLAQVGQFVVPILCLGGATLSWWRRRQRHQLVEGVNAAQSASVLNGMTWQEFELLVGEAFRLQGYQVTEMGGGGADGGIDLVLAKGGETFLVQCKQWRALKVGVDVVRELYGVMAAKGAAGGFVVTSGRYTDDAKAFVEGRNIRLIDGTRLYTLIQQAKGRSSQSVSTSLPNPLAASALPACPQCSTPMVRRSARRGANAGKDFWGCTGYPSCKGTRPIG